MTRKKGRSGPPLRLQPTGLAATGGSVAALRRQANRETTMKKQPHGMDRGISENMAAMLDTLALRLLCGQTNEMDYARTLNYLRFRIGEDLYDRYASPLAREKADRIRVPGDPG